jgi:hypothetical protein
MDSGDPNMNNDDNERIKEVPVKVRWTPVIRT